MRNAHRSESDDVWCLPGDSWKGDRSVRILDHVYLVGGGDFGVSNVTDCHVYLIDGGSELALIDAGSGIQPDRIVRNIEKAGFSPQDVSVILLTHSHWDHARGARALAEATGADVAIHRNGQKVLTEEYWQNDLVTKVGFEVETPRPADRLLDDGDVVKVGDIEVTLLETLGHTPDACVYLIEDSGLRVMFSGDTLAGDGALGATAFNTDFAAYKRGIERMHDWAPDAILPGHRIFTLSNGTAYTKRAVDLFNSSWQNITATRQPFYPSSWLLNYGHDVEGM